MTQLLILVLVVATGIVLFQIWRKQQGINKKTTDQVRSDSNELRLENVTKGGVIHLNGIGENLEDFDVSVLSRHVYAQDDYTWYELEGDKGDEKVWIEFEADDELDISIKLHELKLRDIGVNKEELRNIDEEEEGTISYKGEKYYYEDSDSAIFYRHGMKENGEKFYYWDFENDEGNKFISVEKWGGGDYEVSLSVPIRESQITVYSLSK